MAQNLAQILIETPYDINVPDDLREQVWKVISDPTKNKNL